MAREQERNVAQEDQAHPQRAAPTEETAQPGRATADRRPHTAHHPPPPGVSCQSRPPPHVSRPRNRSGADAASSSSRPPPLVASHSAPCARIALASAFGPVGDPIGSVRIRSKLWPATPCSRLNPPGTTRAPGGITLKLAHAARRSTFDRRLSSASKTKPR